jgi:hypothetical protein
VRHPAVVRPLEDRVVEVVDDVERVAVDVDLADVLEKVSGDAAGLNRLQGRDDRLKFHLVIGSPGVARFVEVKDGLVSQLVAVNETNAGPSAPRAG